MNALRLVNPQRWNEYAYAINSPVSYTDPDGRGAILVDFNNLAEGLGHWGVIEVDNSTGAAVFTEFGPEGESKPVWKGAVKTYSLASPVERSNDLPTPESMRAIVHELAQREGQPTSSIALIYYKTPDAETEALKTAIDNYTQRGYRKIYCVVGPNCMSYAATLLSIAGIKHINWALDEPNSLFRWLEQFGDRTFPDDSKKNLREGVTHKIRYCTDAEIECTRTGGT